MVSRLLWTSREKRDILARIRAHESCVPQRIAMECGDRSITYGALTELVDERLRSLVDPVRPGQFVPIEHPRSIEFVVDFLAVLTLGGIPVPIDPDLPAPRRDLLSDRPAACVVDGAYIVFASDHTGKPRPVLGSATSLRAFLEWQSREFEIGRGDRVGFLSALGSDAVVRDIFSA